MYYPYNLTVVKPKINKWKIFIVQRLLERPWRFNELQKISLASANGS